MTQPFRFSPLLPLLFLVALLSGCASTEKPPIAFDKTSQQGNSRAASDALQLQGHPYVYGGMSPQEGFDCSGLVVYVYNKQGLKLPRTAQSLAQQLPGVNPEQRQPGDLLFFNTDKPFSHVGIYVGNDNFVHAPSARTGRVMLSNLKQPYWRDRFIAVRRPQRSQPLSLNESTVESCGLN
jgi:cell wall-associated NlpC family hydrolase